MSKEKEAMHTAVDNYGAINDQKSVGPQQPRDFQLISVPQAAPVFSFRKLWAFSGPGFLMSIAYLDPGNIESDLQAGSLAQYQLLWVLFWCTLCGLIIQLLAAKLGVVTGQHLAQVCRKEYALLPRLGLWIAMELAIIGADIQEVIGSAIALNIISQGTLPLWMGCLITAIDTFTFLFLESYGLRYLEGFFGFLIMMMVGMFGWMYIAVKPVQAEVVKGLFLARVPSNSLEQALGVVGAVIMPHNLYLHSGLVLSREISREDKTQIKEGIKYNSIESAIALLVSFIINMFVLCVFGATVYSTNLASYPVELQTLCAPDQISLLNAHKCLYYAFGQKQWIIYIWALGLLAGGQSSTMTGTYAGQFVMEGFLDIKWAKWKRVLLTRSIAIVPCVIIAIAAHSRLDALSEWINVEQSLLLPFSLIPILQVTSNRKIMGDFTNSWFWIGLTWFIGFILLSINIYFVIDYLILQGPWFQHVIAGIGLTIYVLMLLFYLAYPLLTAAVKKYRGQMDTPLNY